MNIVSKSLTHYVPKLQEQWCLRRCVLDTTINSPNAPKQSRYSQHRAAAAHSQVRRLEQVEPIFSSGHHHAWDLGVPMHFLHVMLPAVHEQQLSRQICRGQGICLCSEGRFFFRVPLQSQVPHSKLVIAAGGSQDTAFMMGPLN